MMDALWGLGLVRYTWIGAESLLWPLLTVKKKIIQRKHNTANTTTANTTVKHSTQKKTKQNTADKYDWNTWAIQKGQVKLRVMPIRWLQNGHKNICIGPGRSRRRFSNGNACLPSPSDNPTGTELDYLSGERLSPCEVLVS